MKIIDRIRNKIRCKFIKIYFVIGRNKDGYLKTKIYAYNKLQAKIYVKMHIKKYEQFYSEDYRIIKVIESAYATNYLRNLLKRLDKSEKI